MNAPHPTAAQPAQSTLQRRGRSYISEGGNDLAGVRHQTVAVRSPQHAGGKRRRLVTEDYHNLTLRRSQQHADHSTRHRLQRRKCSED
jgi:hypothetical protein